MVFELRLIGQSGAAVGATGILRLDQPGARVDLPNARHAEHGRAQLVQQGPDERAVIAMMRIPVAVQRAEPRRRERLVDGRIVLKPGISSRDRGGVRREVFGERGVEQMRARGGRCHDGAASQSAGCRPARSSASRSSVHVQSAVASPSGATRSHRTGYRIARKPIAAKRERCPPGDRDGQTSGPDRNTCRRRD